MEWREGESEKEIHRGGAEGESAREGAKTPSDSFCQWNGERANRRRRFTTEYAEGAEGFICH